MAEYRFLTTWLLDAPIALVWDAIHDVEAWPDWWHGILSVTKLEEGDQAGVGAVYGHRWRSVLPFVRWMKDPEFRALVAQMPEPGTRSYFIVDDREAGSVSVLIEPGYRLSEAALGEIVLTAATRWADADKLTVAMPDTLAGIAPQCVVSLNTDVRDILDRPGSLMA